MSFLLRAGVETCTLCGVSVGTGWRAKTGHVCARPIRVKYDEYDAALTYQDAADDTVPGIDPTRCIHGHDWTPANTRIDARGYKRCRQCDSDSKRASQTSCVSRVASPESAPDLGKMRVSETAPSATSKPFLVPRDERSTSMNRSATQPITPSDSRGVV